MGKTGVADVAVCLFQWLSLLSLWSASETKSRLPFQSSKHPFWEKNHWRASTFNATEFYSHREKQNLSPVHERQRVLHPFYCPVLHPTPSPEPSLHAIIFKHTSLFWCSSPGYTMYADDTVIFCREHVRHTRGRPAITCRSNVTGLRVESCALISILHNENQEADT